MADNTTPAPFVAGDEWWQQLISYGISRKVDAQYLEPYKNNSTEQTAMDARGNAYTKGKPAYVAAAGGVNWLLVIGGLVAVGALVFALKR